MKSISLSQGKFAIVDDGDFEYLNQQKWYYAKGGYASTRNGVYMHSIVANTPKGMLTDHINGNKLDNRRKNLRVCTASENARNRNKQINNTSGYKGVTRDRINNKWRSDIQIEGKHINLGRYESLSDAIKAYNVAAEAYHGDFAKPNSEAV